MMRQQDTARREKILSDSIWKLMLTMSLPAIIAMTINGLNTFVDGIFVGQYIGQNALAAVSLVLPLTILTNGIASMIGMGSASLLSIVIGKNDVDIQSKILGTATLLSFLFSVLLTGLGWVFAYELLALMGGKGEIQELGVIYYRILLIGAFFRIYAVVINMLIRAEGKVQEAMLYAIIASVINIILNYIFIVRMGMGIEAAAWSTVIAMLIFSLLNAWYFYVGKKASFPISFTSFSLEGKLVKPIFNVGVSAMMLQFMFFLQQVVVFRSIANYGDDFDITFMGACYRILLLVILPGYGFAQAMQPIVGINFGAGMYTRVRKSFRSFMIAYTVMLLIILVFVLLFPRITLAWMIPNTEFSQVDIWNYQVMMACLPFYPYFLMTTTLFQGIGEGKAAAILLIVRTGLFFIPLTLLLPLWFDISGIYMAWLPVSLMMVFICYWMVSMQFNRFLVLSK